MSSAAIGRLEKALAIQRAETRRQAELWLAAHTRNDDSLRIFQSLYEDAPVGYVTLSRSGNVVDVNNKVAALLEREPRAIRGRPLLFFIHRSSTDRFLRHVAGCREGAESITSEVVLRVGPDHTIPVELISTRTTLLDGTIGYQTIVNDLSVREAIQRAIAASEKRYREIVETANDGICIVGPSNRITFSNPAFSRLTGRSPDRLLGRPLESLLVADDVDAERSAFGSRGSQRVREQRFRRADGSIIWTSVSTSILLDHDGAFAGMLKMFADISDRKELEAARQSLVRHLVSAQEAERHRVARELHDQMGQHLVGLSLGLKRLAQLGAESAEITQITQRLQSLADTMARDVQHLAFELRPASLDDLGLAEAVSNYADGIGRRFGLEVDVQCERMTRLDSSAETAIYRIVQEALTNIVKHAKAQRVSIILEPRSDRLQVIVEDDGVGFHPELVLRDGSDGNRLGLRGMIERASLVSGELQIESRPGRGTTLFLRVPMDGGREDHEETTTTAG